MPPAASAGDAGRTSRSAVRAVRRESRPRRPGSVRRPVAALRPESKQRGNWSPAMVSGPHQATLLAAGGQLPAVAREQGRQAAVDGVGHRALELLLGERRSRRCTGCRPASSGGHEGAAVLAVRADDGDRALVRAPAARSAPPSTVSLCSLQVSTFSWWPLRPPWALTLRGVRLRHGGHSRHIGRLGAVGRPGHHGDRRPAEPPAPPGSAPQPLSSARAHAAGGDGAQVGAMRGTPPSVMYMDDSASQANAASDGEANDR